MKHGNEYIEEKIIITHGTEYEAAEKVRLTPLHNRDDFLFLNRYFSSHFFNEERKVVVKRREEYSNRQV